MSTYTPDLWVVVKITSKEVKSHHRVFACWYGGYLGSDSWKLNSGITKVTLKDNCYHFDGTSGSVYICHKNGYGASGYGSSVLQGMIDDAAKAGASIEIIKEEVNVLEIDYESKS